MFDVSEGEVFEDLGRNAAFAGGLVVGEGADHISKFVGVAGEGGVLMGGGVLLDLPEKVVYRVCFCGVAFVEVGEKWGKHKCLGGFLFQLVSGV